jgi:hypothetical protein
MRNTKQLIESIRTLVREVIAEKSTKSTQSWAEMMHELSKEVDKPIKLDDVGNYNVCDCEPHHISIRPIVHDIYDLQYFKDGADRQKVLYVPFSEVKKYVKAWLNNKTANYVDNAYSRNIENSKDKEGSKKSESSVNEKNLIDPEKNNKFVKNVKVNSMNKSEDDPTTPMRYVKSFDKQIDSKSKKPSYSPPTLPKKLQKLVVKYTKAGKIRKK